MDKKKIHDFLKDLQGVCFKHNVRFDPSTGTIKATGKLIMSNLIAEAEGCQVNFYEDNNQRQIKRAATGKYQ